jgi:hypothetical protein
MHFLSAGLDRVGLIGSAMPPDCVLDDGPDDAVAGTRSRAKPNLSAIPSII